MRGGIKFSIPNRLQQQPRYQLCSALHSKLDEDMTQVKLDRLLAHQQTQTDLGVRQSLNTTQRHLCFTPAQVLVLNYSLNYSFESTIADAAVNSFRIRLHATLFAARNHFVGSEDAISRRVIARAVAVGLHLACDTEFRHQTLESAPDRAEADNVGKLHQGSNRE